MFSTFNRNPPVHSEHPSLNPGLDRIQTASIRSSRRHLSTARVTQRLFKDPVGWAALERARYFFIDSHRTSVAIRGRLLNGFFATGNGSPCRRVVVDRFGVVASVVIDQATGRPWIQWVDNGLPSHFKIQVQG